VICGHGSHLNPDSSAPVYDHAARIREGDSFAEVREAFWKEEPSLRNALRTVESEDVIVVPLFTSEGYFTEGVLPRELRLAGIGDNDADDGDNGGEADRGGDRTGGAESELDVGKRVWYADPVGTHRSMTDAIVARAERIAGDPAIGPETGLAVIGHGTERNPKSARATRDHAARIDDRGRFAEVEALFMDQAPFVEEVLERFSARSIVAVPLFVADGFHTREEIPELLGLAGEFPNYENPSVVDGREIRYAGAVGTDPAFADVIVERARDAFTRAPDADNRSGDTGASEPENEVRAAREAFLGYVEGGIEADGATPWGELLISAERDAGSEKREAMPDRSQTYELRHGDDRELDSAALDTHTNLHDARELARFDEEGAYRPLKSAPTLAGGWRLADIDGRELYRAVSSFYPASIENWYRERCGELDVTDYAETAARQTGMYDPIGELEGEALDRAVRACCTDEVCLKRRVWESGEGGGNDGDNGEGNAEAGGEGREIDAPPGNGEFPCREPCSLFVAAAREFVLADREDDEDGGNDGKDAADGIEAGFGVEDDGPTLTETDREDLDAILTDLAEEPGGVRPVRPGEASDPRNQYRARYLREKLRALDEGRQDADRRAAGVAPSQGGTNR
jgi:sirohydrochlorin cobaltochelatase